MKKIYIFVCLMLVSAFGFSQWTWLNPIQTNNRLKSIKFIDANTGFFVGDCGTIFKTTDAGVNWVQQKSGTVSFLYSIFCVDANTAYVSGGNGTILKTTNGGNNWVSQVSGTTNILCSVFFTDSNTGYISGFNGMILKTTNSGANWYSLTSGTTRELFSIAFSSSTTGFAAGYNGTLIRTTNAGMNWSSFGVGPNSLRSIDIVDPNNIYIVGDGGRVLKSTNAGNNWSGLNTGSSNNFNSVHFLDVNLGYVVGASGTIIKTLNGGVNWSTQTCSTTSEFESVNFTDTNNGFAVGWLGILYKTSDGGANWVAHPPVLTRERINSVFFNDANTGCIVGNTGLIYKTTNGGNNWLSVISGTTGNLNSVYFTNNNNTGYIAGDYGRILKTTNAGNSWVILSSGTTTDLYSVFFTDLNNGYVVGWNGVIYKTTNGGTNWASKPSGTSSYLASIYFTDNNTGFAVGASGTIIKTTNAGNNWFSLTSGVSSTINEVFFTNSNTGFAVGATGTVLKTTNAGSTWLLGWSGSSRNLFSVYFVDANNGYAAGANGTILNSTDAGANWSLQMEGSLSSFLSINFTDPNTGYTVGYDGSILKYTNGLPGRSSTPVGPNALCENSPNSVYTTNGVNYATSYIWEISPTAAGVISGGGLTGTVDWNDTYSGTAQITVKGHNALGDGAVSFPCLVNIDPKTIAGNVSGIDSICEGTSTGTLTLNGYSGTINKWQKRLNAGSWIDIANSASTYSEIPSSTGTWEYRAEVQSGICNALFSTPVSVVVSPQTIGGSVNGGGSVCIGSSTGTLTLTGYNGTILKWQKRLNTGSWVDITNTLPTYSEIPSSVGTWEYRAQVKNEICDPLFSNSTTVVVSPQTVAGSVSGGGNICLGNSTGTLTLSGHTGSVNKWQKRLNSGSWIDIANTTNIYSETPSSLGTWEYRAEVQSGTCPVLYSSAATVIVVETVAGSVSGGGAICEGISTGILTLSGYTGTINKWQKRLNTGSWIDITNTLPTYSEIPSSAGTWQYRAEVQNGVCPPLFSTAETVVVSPQSVGGSITGSDTICFGNSTGTLTLTGYTGSINKWQKRFNSGNWLDITNTLPTYSETPTSVGTWDYRAEVQSGSCPATFSVAKPVVVVDIPPITPVIIQQGDSLISSSAANNQWFNSIGLIPGAIYQVYHPTLTENYYVKIKVDNCYSLPSNIIYFIYDGIDNFNYNHYIKIYPNPAHDLLFVKIYLEGLKYDSGYEMKIFSIQGQLLFKSCIQQDNIIDVSKLPSGVYFLKIQLEDGLSVFKFIKE